MHDRLDSRISVWLLAAVILLELVFLPASLIDITTGNRASPAGAALGGRVLVINLGGANDPS
jgi:hypothetical protein